MSGCGTAPTDEQAEKNERVDTTTEVKILAVNPHVGRAIFRLSCGPPAEGDIPSPERACAALRENPGLVTSPRRFICGGGYGAGWDITISGRIEGRRFRSRTGTCWTPQMETISRLGIASTLDSHLVPRAHVDLAGGTQTLIPAGVLQAADLVICRTHGRRLEQGVPIEAEATSSTGYDGAGVRAVWLRVTRHEDGSVSASCT